MKNDFDITYLRKKFTRYVLFIAIFIVLLVVFVMHYADEKRLKEQERVFHNYIHNNIEYILNDYSDRSSIILKHLIKELDIANMIKDRNREDLYKALNKRWNGLKKHKEHLVVFHIHLKDGTSFLRVHRPKKFGDNLFEIRPMVKQMAKKQKKLVGYETGLYYTPYRVIEPIFDEKNKYIGSVEFGYDMNFIIDYLYKTNKNKGLVFIKNEALDLLANTDNISIEGYRLQSKIPSELKNVFTKLNIKHLNSCSDIELNGKKYKTHYNAPKI